MDIGDQWDRINSPDIDVYIDIFWTVVLSNWCFWTVVLERTFESPLDCKEIQPVHPKGNQSWIFIGRTDAEAETPILWPPDAKNWLTGKDPDAGKDWRQEEKGTTENEMVGWHHRLNGHKPEQAPGVGDGQGGRACCSPCGRRVTHDWETELNWVRSTHTWIFDLERWQRQSGVKTVYPYRKKMKLVPYLGFEQTSTSDTLKN